MSTVSGATLRPNLALSLGGGFLIAMISLMSLPWPSVVASTALGTLMIAGADVDARTYLLPDTITFAALVAGIAFAPALDPSQPWIAIGMAIARAAAAACGLAALRWLYAWIRDEEGLGIGDIKLGAVGGAWLSFATLPMWFGLASAAALFALILARLRGQAVDRTTRVPFGAFLCPALWLVFFWTALLERSTVM